jgi:hypothetical protein
MPARLKFLTASPQRRDCFAAAPQNFAGRPEEMNAFLEFLTELKVNRP